MRKLALFAGVPSANCVFDVFLLAAKLKPSHREVQGDGEAAKWVAGSVLAGAGAEAVGEPAECAGFDDGLPQFFKGANVSLSFPGSVNGFLPGREVLLS